MTFREAQALLLLWGACPDAEVRKRAAALVPELEEWETPPAEVARRWRAFVRSEDGLMITEETLVCRETDLLAHVEQLRGRFDLTNAKVEVVAL